MNKNQSHIFNLKLWLCFCLAFTTANAQKVTSNPAALYKQNCASCHDALGNARIPKFSSLRQMSAEAALHSLQQGAMKSQAQSLTPKQKHLLAEYVSGKKLSITPTVPAGNCSPTEDLNAQVGWNGWGVNLSNTRFQPSESAQLSAADVPKLKLRWAFAFPHQSTMMAQPAVAGGRLYIGSADGTIYSLNARSGCT